MPEDHSDFTSEALSAAFGLDFSGSDANTRAYYSAQLREQRRIAQATGSSPSTRHQLGIQSDPHLNTRGGNYYQVAQMSNASGSATPLSALGRAVVTNGDTVGLNALARVDEIIRTSAQPADSEYLSLTATLRRLQTDYASVLNGTRDARASLTSLMQYRQNRPRQYSVTMGQLESDDAEVPEGFVAWKPKDEDSETAIEAWKAQHPGQEIGPIELTSCLTANDSKSFEAMLKAARRK